jgi:ubiquinone/menaquinone biosynthesis C-methylase UbiE
MAASATQAERIANVGYDYGAREKEHMRACNLCGNDTFAVLSDRDRYGFDARTHLCLRCGLGFISPHLTPDEYLDFYARWYRPLCDAMTGGREASGEMDGLVNDQLSYARWLNGNLLSRFVASQHHTLLDVGGSTGSVASYLARQHSLAPVVLDPSGDELVKARAQGCKCIHALWEEYEPDGTQYDIVLLCRTIDHLLDIAGSLRKIRRLIAPGGLFYVDIVDFEAVAKNCNCISRATKIDHVYYLTHQPTIWHLQSAGFEPVAVDLSRSERIAYLCRLAEPREIEPDPSYALQLLDSLKSIPRSPRPRPRANRSLMARGVRRLLSYVR